MALIRCLLAGALAAGLALPAPVSARDHHRHRNRDNATGAAIGLAIVGLAAVAASSRKERRDNRSYYDRNDYRGNWGDTYSAAKNVVCYRSQRQCYRKGYYSAEWTSREFGYDPYNRGY
jgi:hypothetical protein